MTDTVCRTCGKAFTPIRKNQRDCSDACRRIYKAKYLADYHAKHRGAEHPEIKCPVCGKMFRKKNRQQIFCSAECRDKDRGSYVVKEKAECVVCGKMFERRTLSNICCSPRCSEQRRKEKCREYYREYVQRNQITRACVVCGETFTTYRETKKVCSPECRNVLSSMLMKDRAQRNKQGGAHDG